MNKTDVMIHRTSPIVHAVSWQAELANTTNNLQELLEATGNSSDSADKIIAQNLDFPVRVPLSYLSRIKQGDINDPLLRQVLPVTEEFEDIPGYLTDPLAEASNNVQSGIIHKYQGRVLLVLAGACAINCRYCFRRHFPYNENQNNFEQWEQALDYIRRDPSITEVIYSGGDPLANNDKKLAALTQKIANIQHIKRLRIHTRLPVVIPQRITENMLNWLTDTRLQVSMVIHVNHANELDNNVALAMEKLRKHKITLLNQSVLLKGINDNSNSLIHLSERLFELGVLPYYLHLLDKVKGAAHFNVTAKKAQYLVGEMTSLLPGDLIPKLVFEEPGKTSKTPLTPII